MHLLCAKKYTQTRYFCIWIFWTPSLSLMANGSNGLFCICLSFFFFFNFQLFSCSDSSDSSMRNVASFFAKICGICLSLSNEVKRFTSIAQRATQDDDDETDIGET